MSAARVKVSTNRLRVRARVSRGERAMVAALTNQVVQDGNFFCKQDQGVLMSSALIASQPEKGLAIWDTPYAKRQYYTGAPSKDVNPNASTMWVEKARDVYGDNDWQQIAQKNFTGGMT